MLSLCFCSQIFWTSSRGPVNWPICLFFQVWRPFKGGHFTSKARSRMRQLMMFVSRSRPRGTWSAPRFNQIKDHNNKAINLFQAVTSSVPKSCDLTSVMDCSSTLYLPQETLHLPRYTGGEQPQFFKALVVASSSSWVFFLGGYKYLKNADSANGKYTKYWT